jgi:taurine dioxygenase
MGGIRIAPLTAAVGARLEGVDLRSIDATSIDAIRDALHEHLVVVLRGQSITPSQLVSFGRALGELEIHPFAPTHAEHRELVVLDQVHPVGAGADAWHADATFTPSPPAIGILQAITLPKLGGDTCFASVAAAYDALSEPLKGLLEKVRGVHDLTRQLSLAIMNGNTSLDLRDMQERWPPHPHPAVITHPVTGRRGLFVNSNYTTRLEGLTPAEGERLLPFLCEHVRSPEFQMRVRWEPGTLVLWDNRFVQHFAVPDYQERRVMHRLNVAGTPPA